MAKIVSTAKQGVFTISRWLGVNENPDGDTKLKMGEASESRNWRITKDGHLQIRPGYAPFVSLGNEPVLDMWHGFVAKVEITAAVCAGKLWVIASGAATDKGAVTGSSAHMFGFSEKLYILTGSKYYEYDGTTLSEVTGYRPMLTTETLPTGGGTSLEQVNKLCGLRRARYSPDGTAKDFHLAETGIVSVDYVKNVTTGTNYTVTTDYTVNLTTGTVTFVTVPAKGVDTIEIGWTFGTNYRSQVEAMKFAETYNGATDTRIFIYGDGSNKAFYSGLDFDGKPRADYFPDMNEMAVDSANTPITSMIKHFNALLVFKTDGSFITTYGTVTKTDGAIISAFYVTPLNREIGNAAPGQAVLVRNNPFTLHGRSVYEWLMNSYAVKDERIVKCKSDRVRETLGNLDLTKSVCYDDEYNTEYYVCQNGKAVVYNYTTDTWSIYTNIPATCFISINGVLYFGTGGGKIMKFSRSYRNDNGTAIDAYWKSGAMDFQKDFLTKYSSETWIAMKPESQARVSVTAQSNRKSVYETKTVASSLITFTHLDFAHFSFATNRQPQVYRERIKLKKFVFMYLIFESVSTAATATILGADVKVRYAGDAK